MIVADKGWVRRGTIMITHELIEDIIMWEIAMKFY